MCHDCPRADQGPGPDGDTPQNHSTAANRCAPAHLRGDHPPIGLGLKLTKNGSTRVQIVDEHHAVPHEDLVLDRHTFADEGMALDLAPRADHDVLLDLDERADPCVVADLATV
jgi:hypothetical protein